jgi:hypothetical protein
MHQIILQPMRLLVSKSGLIRRKGGGKVCSGLGCACLKKNHYFASKRNDIRFACVLHAHAKTNYFFRFLLLLFASNFSLPTKAKLIQRIFALFRFRKFFFSLRFASDFSFRFKAKQNKHFLLCFALKRNEINVFSLLFTSPGIGLKN